VTFPCFLRKTFIFLNLFRHWRCSYRELCGATGRDLFLNSLVSRS